MDGAGEIRAEEVVGVPEEAGEVSDGRASSRAYTHDRDDRCRIRWHANAWLPRGYGEKAARISSEIGRSGRKCLLSRFQPCVLNRGLTLYIDRRRTFTSPMTCQRWPMPSSGTGLTGTKAYSKGLLLGKLPSDQ